MKPSLPGWLWYVPRAFGDEPEKEAREQLKVFRDGYDFVRFSERMESILRTPSHFMNGAKLHSPLPQSSEQTSPAFSAGLIGANLHSWKDVIEVLYPLVWPRRLWTIPDSFAEQYLKADGFCGGIEFRCDIRDKPDFTGRQLKRN